MFGLIKKTPKELNEKIEQIEKYMPILMQKIKENPSAPWVSWIVDRLFLLSNLLKTAWL